MTSKRDIQLHLDGIAACDAKNFKAALTHFKKISVSSYAQIAYNIGSCHLRLNENEKALECFNECMSRDKYMAIGHFQHGVVKVLCGQLASALESLKAASEWLRGNAFLDYKQQNMPCKLYACEISYNYGLVLLFSGDRQGAREYMTQAGKGMMTDVARCDFIADGVRAVLENNIGYFGGNPAHRLLRVPEKAFFGVSKNKSEGLKASTIFMAPAQVVAAASEDYTFTGFVGARNLPDSSEGGRRRRVGGVIVGPPPSVPPPRLPPSPSQISSEKKSLSPGVADLQQKIQSNLDLSNKTSPQRKPPVVVPVTFQFEAKLNLSSNMPLDSVITKLQEKLQVSTSNIPFKFNQQRLNLTVGNQNKLSIKSDADWESAWTSLCDSNVTGVVLCIKESEQREDVPTVHKLKPSRPAPKLN